MKALEGKGSIKNKVGINIILPINVKHLRNRALLSDCFSKPFNVLCARAVKIIIMKRVIEKILAYKLYKFNKVYL